MIDSPGAGPAARRATLTVGMAVYDDYDGAYFTALALRLFHPEVADRVDIIVLDNNPHGRAAEPLSRLQDRIPNLRYLPVDYVTGTAVRDLIFREAQSDWVLCVDCHVLLAPGSLARLLDFIDANPGCLDLLQGPLLCDDTSRVLTHMEPVWSGLFGVWGSDPRGRHRDQAPFEITMQGLGLFGCRKDAWPGFNNRMRGHGGEEGYLHKKFRAAGRRTLCLPFLRWTHRFDRPGGIPYSILARDRVRNYLIGWEETGMDIQDALDHFRETVDAPTLDRWLNTYAEEKASPFSVFDDLVVVLPGERHDDLSRLNERTKQLGIADRVRCLSAPDLPQTPHVARALTHRLAIEQARRRGLDNILLIDHDTILPADTSRQLATATDQLRTLPWAACLIGGTERSAVLPRQQTPTAPPSLQHAAVAYHASAFDSLLAALPTCDDQDAWGRAHTSLEECLAQTFTQQLVSITRTGPAPVMAATEGRP
ncbi:MULTISPECIES: glycosyltransferase [unclassified Streptomyces]|uniref:glycosyltransferase n=1 Tax=unclassified Streptomyces TaxID=2593676 RepID=UPI00332255B1